VGIVGGGYDRQVDAVITQEALQAVVGRHAQLVPSALPGRLGGAVDAGDRELREVLKEGHVEYTAPKAVAYQSYA
jgi:hypothetical protein